MKVLAALICSLNLWASAFCCCALQAGTCGDRVPDCHTAEVVETSAALPSCHGSPSEAVPSHCGVAETPEILETTSSLASSCACGNHGDYGQPLLMPAPNRVETAIVLWGAPVPTALIGAPLQRLFLVSQIAASPPEIAIRTGPDLAVLCQFLI